jgi:hypothetical protein
MPRMDVIDGRRDATDKSGLKEATPLLKEETSPVKTVTQ